MQCWESLSSSDCDEDHSDCDEDHDEDMAWPFTELQRWVCRGHAPPHSSGGASSDHPLSADDTVGSLRRSIAMENDSARASLAQWSTADVQRLQRAATWMTRHCLETLAYGADVAFEAVETLLVAVTIDLTIDPASHLDGSSLDRALDHWAACGGMQYADNGTLLRLLCAVCVAQASRRYAPRGYQVDLRALGAATGCEVQVLKRIDGAVFTTKANHCQACTNMATLIGDWVDVVVTRCADRHHIEHGDLLSRCIRVGIECVLEIDSDLILFTPPSLFGAAIVHVVAAEDIPGAADVISVLHGRCEEDYRSVLEVVDARYKLRHPRETSCHTPPPPDSCARRLSPRPGKRRRLELHA